MADSVHVLSSKAGDRCGKQSLRVRDLSKVKFSSFKPDALPFPPLAHAGGVISFLFELFRRGCPSFLGVRYFRAVDPPVVTVTTPLPALTFRLDVNPEPIEQSTAASPASGDEQTSRDGQVDPREFDLAVPWTPPKTTCGQVSVRDACSSRRRSACGRGGR